MACPLTIADYKTRLGDALDDTGLVYYTAAEVIHAVNVGQRLFAFLTLCVERTVNFNLANATTWYAINAQLADFLVPLRTYYNGVRLRPDTPHTLDARDSSWRATAGTPTRYGTLGFNLLFLTPQLAVGVGQHLSLTYAATPAELANDGDSPEIPADHHIDLIDFSIYWLRLKEGGQEGANAVQYLQRFLQAAQKYSSFTRARGRAQNYDVAPLDLTTIDMARFEWKLPKQVQKPQRGKAA